MTEPPLLARALLRAAELLAPATDRVWVDAMQGDLDAAHAEGRALSWAFGCLIAAVRFRGAATFVLTPRWRRAVFSLLLMLFITSTSILSYRATSGAWPFHGVVGFLILLLPLGTGVLAVWRGDRIVVDDRWVRRSLLVSVLAFGLIGLSILVMFVGGDLWRGLAAVRSTASLLFVCSAVMGTLATLAAAILLCINFRNLPSRIPRALPYERRFVFFWGANREKMLAFADANAPEMTLPRSWLINSTVLSAFLLLQAGAQLLIASTGHTLGVGYERFLAYQCALAAIVCAANMLYVIAHLRFARNAR